MTPERQLSCRFYADMINAYRVVPRLIIVAYYTFFILAWYFVVEWFMKVDWTELPSDPVVGAVAAAATAGFPAVILGILTKVLKELTQSYWQNKYNPPPTEQGS